MSSKSVACFPNVSLALVLEKLTVFSKSVVCFGRVYGVLEECIVFSMSVLCFQNMLCFGKVYCVLKVHCVSEEYIMFLQTCVMFWTSSLRFRKV